MSESGALIYPSESKSVLKFSQNNMVGKLDKHLIEEALETFGVPKASSVLSFGVVTKPLLDPAKDGIVSTLGCPPLLSSLKVGEPSWGRGLEELDGPPGTAIDLSLCFQALGVSWL
jgi:hypothetical protein